MDREIKESKENDQILSEILVDRVKQARDKKSLKKVCLDLGVDFI